MKSLLLAILLLPCAAMAQTENTVAVAQPVAYHLPGTVATPAALLRQSQAATMPFAPTHVSDDNIKQAGQELRKASDGQMLAIVGGMVAAAFTGLAIGTEEQGYYILSAGSLAFSTVGLVHSYRHTRKAGKLLQGGE